MQLSRERAPNGPARWRWAGVLLCLLFALGTVLHVAHATPAQAHAPVLQVVAVSDAADPCVPGHAAAGEHCQPTSGCPFCAPVATGVALFHSPPARPPMAAAALLRGRVILPHFHPPRPALHA